jgi:hypothetical protein
MYFTASIYLHCTPNINFCIYAKCTLYVHMIQNFSYITGGLYNFNLFPDDSQSIKNRIRQIIKKKKLILGKLTKLIQKIGGYFLYIEENFEGNRCKVIILYCCFLLLKKV